MANQFVVTVLLVITLMIVTQSEALQQLTSAYWWSTAGGCPGTKNPVDAGLCNCYKFTDGVAGYEIDYDGVTAVTMYNDDGCATPTFTFTSSNGYCGQYGWKSAMIGEC